MPLPGYGSTLHLITYGDKYYPMAKMKMLCINGLNINFTLECLLFSISVIEYID